MRLTNSPAPCRRRALIYMALERPEGTFAGHEEESRQVIQSLAEIDVEATDITGNDLAKTHARYLVRRVGPRTTTADDFLQLAQSATHAFAPSSLGRTVAGPAPSRVRS